MKPLPVSLRRLLAANPDKLEEGWSEQDDCFGVGVWSHWLYLRAGWIDPVSECHLIHERTVADVLEAFRRLRPCGCPECAKGAA